MATDQNSLYSGSPNVYSPVYSLMVPVVIGVPGNVIAILIATRKHNRNLSPCIYMMAMGVADTVLLLNLAWCVCFMFLLEEGILKSAQWIMK
jgi:hypothetical protein